jgi:hypothetical protein
MTTSQAPSLAASLREDILVSVCFGDLPLDTDVFGAVANLARDLDARFRFREILIVAEQSRQEAYLPLVRRVDNLRLLIVRDGTPFYRRRVVAADEAIGDVVLMANAAELAYVDPIGMIERAADEQRAILAVNGSGMYDRTLAAPLIALGQMAGFRVGLRDLRTLAAPRTLLNQLLAHPDPDLALRFPPRDARIPLALAEAAPDMPALREAGQWQRRTALLLKLLIYVAPRLLIAVTLASGMLAAMGFFYAFYAFGAWIVVDDLAPGWLTLSAMLSVTSVFLGVSIMGLSLGVQLLLARVSRDSIDEIASEVSRVDLFGQIASDLNVTLERDRAEPPRRALE